MENTELLIQIQKDISNLKNDIILTTSLSKVSEKWIPRSQVMEFLNYGDTQMYMLEKSGEIMVSQVGRRKFIHRDSLEALLNKNKVKS